MCEFLSLLTDLPGAWIPGQWHTPFSFPQGNLQTQATDSRTSEGCQYIIQLNWVWSSSSLPTSSEWHTPSPPWRPLLWAKSLLCQETFNFCWDLIGKDPTLFPRPELSSEPLLSYTFLSIYNVSNSHNKSLTDNDNPMPPFVGSYGLLGWEMSQMSLTLAVSGPDPAQAMRGDYTTSRDQNAWLLGEYIISLYLLLNKESAVVLSPDSRGLCYS